MILLENQFLRAVFVCKGAELQSLVHKETKLEYMWSGDKTYWPKYSPVLFPIVGGLKNETYYYNDKPYSLPRHGFARENDFAVEQLSNEEVVFTLSENEQTLQVYPFAFILKLRYRLNGATLSCTYEVFNPDNKELLFSVGAHPAFAVPNKKDSQYSDYYLEFNKTEILNRYKLQDGLISDITEPISMSQNRLLLNPQLFYDDAIVLKNMQSNRITLGCTKHGNGLHFTFNDFPYFGIWAAKDAPFVCLEPWCGIADTSTHNQQLITKEGIQSLAPQTNWQRSWQVTCF